LYIAVPVSISFSDDPGRLAQNIQFEAFVMTKSNGNLLSDHLHPYRVINVKHFGNWFLLPPSTERLVNEMSRICSTHGGNGVCTKICGKKFLKKESSWENWTQM
jgi:hypothetical protein